MSDSVPDKKVRLWIVSPGSWLNLSIVSHLPREIQAALKQGHIFAGYFGLICKSIDVNRTRESYFLPCSHLKTGYLGLRTLTFMYQEITHHLFRKKRFKREINRLLMEQAFSGIFHKGIIVEDIRGILMEHVIRLTWHSAVQCSYRFPPKKHMNPLALLFITLNSAMCHKKVS